MVSKETRAKSTFMVGLESEAHPLCRWYPQTPLSYGFRGSTRAYDIFSAILVILRLFTLTSQGWSARRTSPERKMPISLNTRATQSGSTGIPFDRTLEWTRPKIGELNPCLLKHGSLQLILSRRWEGFVASGGLGGYCWRPSWVR
jgi:hypothetical protein